MKDNFEIFREEYKYIYPTTFDKNAKLHTDPHYSDNRFKEEQTIFGEQCDGIKYDYSDRIVEWDREKSKLAREHANQSGLEILIDLLRLNI